MTITPRQRQVWELVARGQTTATIATTLGISIKTAGNHRTELMRRLLVHNVADLTRLALAEGVIASLPSVHVTVTKVTAAPSVTEAPAMDAFTTQTAEDLLTSARKHEAYGRYLRRQATLGTIRS